MAAWGVGALASVPMVVVLMALAGPGSGAWTHLQETVLADYVLNTTALMGLTGLIALGIGVSTAWLVAATAFPGRRLFGWALVLPLAAPAYIIAYLYTELLAFTGPVQTTLRDLFGWQAGDYSFPNIRSVPGAALMLGLVLYPYVYLLARAAFTVQAAAPFQAARTLGLTAWQAFFRVALPCARPAIVGGLALVLMETLADFGVADYFAIPTFSTGIFRTWLAMGEKDAALKLAGVMLVVVIALLALEAASRKGRVDEGGRAGAPVERLRLTGPRAGLAVLACTLPILLGFLIPIGVLISYTIDGGDPLWGRGFAAFAANSVTVAVLTGVIATGLALMLAYARRQSGSTVVRGAIRLSTLGYALPGALLAVGLLGPIGGVDRALTRFAIDTFGWSGGLILSGTIVLLVYACVIRFLTVAYNAVYGSLTKVPPAMDAAARSLGARPGAVIRRIHLPLIRPGLAAGALLVFVDVMRELPATLLLRPFNFDTLATRVYWLASDERLTEASTAALMIVLIGLIPILLLNRYSQRQSL